MLLENRHHPDRVPVYASSSATWDATSPRVTKLEGVDARKALAKVSHSNKTLDYTWLKGAAQTYNLSDDIKDYVITEIPIVSVGLPNRNLHCFGINELTFFDPRFGTFVYKTFVGKPTYIDHDNKIPTEARGIHLDASLRKVPGWNVWKIYVLVGFDRTKDPVTARAIEKGTRRSYSMGCWVSYFISSITGQITNSNQVAKYPKGSVHNGVLAYDECIGCEFFETSSLEGGPADVTAESHQLWYF